MLSLFSVKMSTPTRRFRIHRKNTPRPLTPIRETPQPSQDVIARLTPKRNKDCRYCNRDYPLQKCFRFGRLPAQVHIAVVRKHRYCFNCLTHSHRIRNCQSCERCGVCLGEHHTLLHRDFKQITNDFSIAHPHIIRHKDIIELQLLHNREHQPL